MIKNIFKILIGSLGFCALLFFILIGNTNAQSVSRIYLELKSNSKNITCNNTDECEYSTITKNSPFDILSIRQTGLTISANSEHYYEINFNVNSFIPLGSEEWYFNEPIFRVINSSGTKYDVTCKSKTWSLVQDFTQLGDRVYRSYRYACNWDTTGEFVAVELVMDTQPYDGFNTTFTGVKVNSWNYTDSIGAGAIIENNNQNTDLIINNQNNNQQQTNDRLDNIDNTLNDSNVDSNIADNLLNALDKTITENGVITDLFLMPAQLFGGILGNINGQCQPFNIGSLFGTDLILPCIDVSDYIGETLWGVIDVLFSGFLIFTIGKKIYMVFDTFTSLKDGDIIG